MGGVCGDVRYSRADILAVTANVDGDVEGARVIDMIGRASEAAAIARFVEQVPDGPVGLLIEGEAGIGKTTVVLEAIRQAREAGFQVLRVQPAEAEADLSHAAFTDLIGGIFDGVRDELPGNHLMLRRRARP